MVPCGAEDGRRIVPAAAADGVVRARTESNRSSAAALREPPRRFVVIEGVDHDPRPVDVDDVHVTQLGRRKSRRPRSRVVV
jgi:hypothetical protein